MTSIVIIVFKVTVIYLDVLLIVKGRGVYGLNVVSNVLMMIQRMPVSNNGHILLVSQLNMVENSV